MVNLGDRGDSAMRRSKKYPQKLFFTYGCIYLVALLLFFLITLYLFYRQQYIKTLDTQSQLVRKTSEQIDSSLQNMDRIANGLLFNKTFLQTFIESTGSPVAESQILNDFTALDAPLFPSHRIIAFTDSLYFNLSKSGENETYIQQAIAQWPFRKQLLEQNGQKLFIPPHQDPFDNLTHLVYSVARPISDDKQNYGIIEIQNDYKELEEFCSLNVQSGQIVLFSSDGEIAYPAEVSAEREDFFHQLFSGIEPQLADTPADTVRQMRFFRNQISWSRSGYSDWIIVLYCPIAQMVPRTLSWVLTVILIFLLLAVSFMFAARIVTDRLAAPLTQLSEALKEVSLDNLSVELPQQYGIVEIENINRSFFAMFEHLKKSIALNIQLRANEERANYLALQSQMNPHTIYNTIGMIEAVSYVNGDKEVSRLCVCFSHMLRYISDYSKKQYYVEDELQHLEDYAVLTQARYGDRLNIVIRADDALKTQPISKFTLQPLVENSIKHGFSYKFSRLVVEVLIQREPGGWYIRVADNGCGILPDRLEEIQRQIRYCDECLSANQDILNMKIGNLTLSNLYIRYRILFGARFLFEIGNRPDSHGCFIQLTVKEEE